MIEYKRGGVVAGGACILSLLIGLLSGSSLFPLMVRAFFLAVFFFALTVGILYLIDRFLPELLGGSPSGDETAFQDAALASRVDISVGDEDGSPEALAEAGEAEELKTMLDQRGEEGYTEPGDTGGDVPLSAGRAKAPASPAMPPEFVGDVDVLPDLDGFSDSFAAPLVQEAIADEGAGSGSSGRSSQVTLPGSAAKGGAGNFDTKELASAIQTILKRDQKG